MLYEVITGAAGDLGERRVFAKQRFRETSSQGELAYATRPGEKQRMRQVGPPRAEPLPDLFVKIDNIHKQRLTT